jgi:hypothetical protein
MHLQKIMRVWIRRILEEPVAIQTAIQTFLPLLVAFGVVQFDEKQLGALSAFIIAISSLVTRAHVTPTIRQKLDEEKNTEEDGKS